MRIRFLFAFSLAVCVPAQADPMDLLALVKARIASSLDRIPRYMCTVTIDRSSYEPRAQLKRRNRNDACDDTSGRWKVQLISSDRLRLDVTMTSTEIYSWVGERRFDDRDLMDMVREGAISNGTFAAFLSAVFRTEGVNFSYRGEKNLNGRALAEFDFRVPREKSSYRYRYRTTGFSVITGYTGTFLVDPKTGELARFAVRTDLLPPETAACYAGTTLDYGRVRLQGVDFLLPTESRLRIVQPDGAASENRTVFSSCHEFLGESSLTFGPPPDTAILEKHPAEQAPTLHIPAGLHFRVALAQKIDTASAAAGDRIQAELITPIGDPLNPLVAKGAAIVGRIVHIQQFYGSVPSVSLALRLESVNATPDITQSFERTGKKTLVRRAQPVVLRSLGEHAVEFEFRHIRQPYVIPSGVESTWITAQ